MKIIDKTPFQNAQGGVDLSGRIQGTLKYGFDWFGELQVQKTVIAQLERSLEKGFVLIRNFTLPDVDVVIPIILVGPGGIYVIHVTNAKGQFEARGDQWDNVVNGRPMPARNNLLARVGKYGRALQVYLNRQKIQIPAPIEAVLIAANPGAHVDSLRPIARVVMSDAVKQFAASVAQARPIWRPTDNVHDVADRIVSPRPVEEAQPAAQTPEAAQRSRASAIFDAAENAQFNPADLEFAFEEGQPLAPQGTPSLRETSPAQPLPRPSAQKRRILGMTMPQLVFLGAMFIVEFCVLIGFIVYYFFTQQ
ncbi:MAG: NERD domain-containing protein [Chloroflexota bacterium]